MVLGASWLWLVLDWAVGFDLVLIALAVICAWLACCLLVCDVIQLFNSVG